MNRIDELFARKPSGILSLYFCAGHPSPDSTADVVRAAARAGIDLLEVGIPFSDPMADGPVIQDAATRALRGGMTLGRLLDQLAAVRAEVSLPLMLMGYLNPILHYGFEAFCRRCRDCGVDGLVIPDLPFEVYVEEFQATGPALRPQRGDVHHAPDERRAHPPYRPGHRRLHLYGIDSRHDRRAPSLRPLHDGTTSAT